MLDISIAHLDILLFSFHCLSIAISKIHSHLPCTELFHSHPNDSSFPGQSQTNWTFCILQFLTFNLTDNITIQVFNSDVNKKNQRYSSYNLLLRCPMIDTNNKCYSYSTAVHNLNAKSVWDVNFQCHAYSCSDNAKSIKSGKSRYNVVETPYGDAVKVNQSF